MNEQGTTNSFHFATCAGQRRPSLLECAHDPGMLQRHRASTVTPDGRYYPALASLQSAFACQYSGKQEMSLNTASGLLPILDELAEAYDYLLLLTRGSTTPFLMDIIAAYCSRAAVLYLPQ